MVEQVSTNQGSKRISVIKQKQKYIESIIEKTTDSTNDIVAEQKARRTIADAIFDIASMANTTGIPELKESFKLVFNDHLAKADEYRQNLIAFSEGKPVRLAFLIEIHSCADYIYLNNGRTVKLRYNDNYPLLQWMIEEIEKIDNKLIEYVVIYQQNSVNSEKEDVIAVETRDVQGSLRKQGIIIYEYCDDPSEISYTRNGLSKQGYEYSADVNNRDSFQKDLLPILQKAYVFKHKGIPYVAPRSVQAAIYAYGHATFYDSGSLLYIKSEFSQEETLKRFDAFIDANTIKAEPIEI